MKKLILLVEDEIELQQNFKEILEFNDFIVRTADNGLEALEEVSTNQFDLVLSDILMPKMDGITFLKELRKINSYKKTPFIFLTAKVEDRDIKIGKNLGADDYLSKPVSGQMLLHSVFSHIRKQEIKEDWASEKLEIALADSRKITFNEFRDPIYGILSVFELMESSLEDFDLKQFQELIKLGRLSANRINRDLEKLSMYYKWDQLILKPQNICIKQLAEDILSLFHEYDIRLEIIEDETDLDFDLYLFRFLFTELLDNAIKFSLPSSPIFVHIGKRLEIINFQKITNIVGSFIPKPFQKVGLKGEEYPGIGLGLFLSQKICQIHHAQFQATIEADGRFIVSVDFKKDI